MYAVPQSETRKKSEKACQKKEISERGTLVNPPGSILSDFFKMENGDVAMTPEKFDFSREKGGRNSR